MEGLIFITRIDPLSRFLSRLNSTGSDEALFSHVGFCYTSSITGTPQTAVLLADIHQLNLMPEPQTLEQLKNTALVTRLSIRRIQCHPVVLRTALLSVTPIPRNNLNQLIDNLITNYSKKPRSWIDDVMTQIFPAFPSFQSGGISKYWSPGFGSEIMGPLEDVPLQPRTSVDTELAFSCILSNQEPIFMELLQTGLERLRADPNFFIWLVTTYLHPTTTTTSNKDQIRTTLSSELACILESLRNHEAPLINLNTLISAVNDLKAPSETAFPLIRTPISHSAIVFTGQANPPLPIILRSGVRVQLPIYGARVEGWDPEVVKELLEIVEALSLNDLDGSRYDELKARLTEELGKSYK